MKPTPTTNPANSTLTAIILTGDALKPQYRHGDTLAIDTGKQAQTGDAVLAYFDGNPEKKGVMVLNADGDLVGGGYVPRGGFQIVGVVIGRQPARPEKAGR